MAARWRLRRKLKSKRTQAVGSSFSGAGRLEHYNRRLRVESLEPRRLLGGTPPFSQMVVLGDSLSDTGNVPGLVAWGNGYTETSGRFTSGPTSKPPSLGGPTDTTCPSSCTVWNEELASQLGIAVASPARYSGGENYATGGAETGGGDEKGWFGWAGGVTNNGYGYPNVGLQVSAYLSSSPTNLSNTLYAIWAGGNDLVGAADSADSDYFGRNHVPVNAFESTANDAVIQNLEPYIKQLIAAGAQYIVWPDLPELDQIPHTRETRYIYDPHTTGLTPSYPVNGYTSSTDAALFDGVQTFNSDWKTAISDLKTWCQNNHYDTTIYGLDVHSLFEGMLNNNYPRLPTTFDTRDEASKSNNVKDNADNYLFWDGMHPTEYVHKLLGEAAYDLIQQTNDNFASATVITGASATAIGNNVSATTEAGEPVSCNGIGSGQSVWWQWTAPSNGTVQIDTLGSNFETALGVYTGSSVSALSVKASSYDYSDPVTAAQSQQSEVSFNAVAGTTYRISVGGILYTSGVDGTDYYTSGDIKLNVSLTPAPASHPHISSVTPPTLSGLPLPQTQLLTISGSGFTPTSTLQFYDRTTTYYNRVPNFVSASQLSYNIKVGEVMANWTVKVVNPDGWKSNAGQFNVVGTNDTTAPSAPVGLTATLLDPTLNSFNVSWTNPTDPYGFGTVWWKLGSAPTSNTDGDSADLPDSMPLSIYNTSQQSTTLYVWLQDGLNNVNYQNYASVTLPGNSNLPVVAITSPTSSGTNATTNPVLNLAGTVTDSSGTIAALAWNDNLGGSGVFSNTGGTWAVPSIQLLPGVNNILVGAIDDKSNIGITSITVTYSIYQYPEIEPNDTQATATALPLTEDPAGSGLCLGRGSGSIQTTSDVDYWSFTALAGDVVSVSVDRYQNTSLWPYVSLYNAGGNYQAGDSQGGPNGGAFLSHCTIPVSGTYFIRVDGTGNGSTTGAYQMHMELAREFSRRATGPTPMTPSAGPMSSLRATACRAIGWRRWPGRAYLVRTRTCTVWRARRWQRRGVDRDVAFQQQLERNGDGGQRLGGAGGGHGWQPDGRSLPGDDPGGRGVLCGGVAGGAKRCGDGWLGAWAVCAVPLERGRGGPGAAASDGGESAARQQQQHQRGGGSADVDTEQGLGPGDGNQRQL